MGVQTWRATSIATLFAANPNDPLVAEDRFLSLGEDVMLRDLAYDDATGILEVAAMLYPNSRAAHALLAEAYLRAGRKPEAKAEYLVAQKLKGITTTTTNNDPTSSSNDELSRTIVADRLARLGRMGIEK